jgi:hypothetical protein
MAFRAVNFFFHTFHPFPTTPETEIGTNRNTIKNKPTSEKKFFLHFHGLFTCSLPFSPEFSGTLYN